MKRENSSSGLPSGFKELEYIKSTATQWIDTGITPNQDTDFVCDFSVPANVDNTVFGCRYNHQSQGYHLTSYSNIGGNYGHFLYDGTRHYNCIKRDDTRQVVEKMGNEVFLDGALKVTLPSITLVTPRTLTICALNDVTKGLSEKGNTTIFAMQIFQNGNIVRNYIPALRVKDNKPGLYDLCGSICPLTNTPFYVNKGTGEFLYA